MSFSEISESSVSSSLETMSYLTISRKYGEEWRESLNEKYSIPKKEKEMENWKSSVQRMKQEIHEKIEEIHREIKKDTKNFLNCFFEKEMFRKHMNEMFANLEQKYSRRKRRFHEMET
jgi:hypothetical protein